MAITPTFICGAECLLTAATTPSGSGNHWDSMGSNIGPDTTTFNPIGGAAAWQLAANPSGTIMVHPLTNTFPTHSVLRMYFRFASGGSVVPLGLVLWSALSGASCNIQTLSGPDAIRIVAFDQFGRSFSSTIGTINRDQWYLLDVSVDCSTNPWTIQAALNQAPAVSLSLPDSASVLTNANFFSNGCSTTVWIDDIVMSESAGDFPIGPGFVKGYQATSSGTMNQTAGDLKTNSGTNLTNGDSSYTLLQTPYTSTYVAQVVARSTTYGEWVYGTSGATDVPRGVEQVFTWNVGAAAVGNSAGQLYDGTSAGNAYGLTNVSVTQATQFAKTWVTPPSGGSWTLGKLQALRARWGFSTAVSPQPRLRSTFIEAEFYAIQTFTRTTSDDLTVGLPPDNLLRAGLSFARTLSDTYALGAETVVRTALAIIRAASDTYAFGSETANRASLAFTRTLSDTSAFVSEAVARLVATPRTDTDTITLGAETATRASQSFTRTLSDAYALGAETVSRIPSILRSAADTLGTVSESVIRASQTALRAMAETTSLSESVGRGLALVHTAADNIGLGVDALTRATMSIARTTTDSLTTISESVSRASQTILRVATDAPGTLSEAINGVPGIIRDVIDSITSLDDSSLVRALQSFVRSATETIPTTESVSRALSRDRSLADSFDPPTDLLTRALLIPRIAVDVLSTVTDAVAVLGQIFIRALGDAAYRHQRFALRQPTGGSYVRKQEVRMAPDTLVRVFTRIRTGSDSVVSLADSLVRALQTFPRTLTDSFTTITESVVGFRAFFAVLSDTITTISGATLTRLLTLPRTATDTSAFSDAVGKIISFARTTADTITTITAATVTRLLTLPRSPSDALVLAESVGRAARTLVRTLAEASVYVGESLASQFVLARTMVENIPLTESVSVLRYWVRGVSDTITTATDTVGRVIRVALSALDTLAGLLDTLGRTGPRPPGRITGTIEAHDPMGGSISGG